MEIDLATLTKEQLIALVQVRGQAMQMNRQADGLLIEKIADSEIREGDFESFIAAKNEILEGLMKAEEQILAGQERSVAH